MVMLPQQASRKPSLIVPIAIGCGAFAIGALLTFGFVQWKAQQQQLALMTHMIQQIQQPVAPAVVTRAAAPNLLGVATPVPEATPAPEVIVVPASAVVPQATPQAADTTSTAERIRALVSRSSDPLVSAAIAQDVARRETMSVAIQGVNELVDAAVAGDYALSTIEGSDTQAAGLRVAFTDREEDQRQLERLLSSAAEAGMIAYSDAVQSSDGSFNGQIILYDLVERALVNGSPEERNTGAQMQEKALALLGKNNPAVVASATSDGERFYTVEAGDSLAYIALQFYGNTNAYQRIFQANRGKLSSPEKIQIGQRLLIPKA